MAIDLSYVRGPVKELADELDIETPLAVFVYIEGFYNRKRRHSAPGYLTPCQYENLLYSQAVAA